MLKLLVIADDFTGALDTGVQFSNLGIQTLVSTDTKIEYKTISDNIQVLVLNAESRYLSFDEAYQIIKEIIEVAKSEAIPFIYKKVDSALRGNVSAEIRALYDNCDQKIIPFLPSYPEMNRVLIDGNLYIDDVLVSESVFASDPYEPVVESNVIQRLQQEANLLATLVSDRQVFDHQEGINVFDAQTESELEDYAAMLEEQQLLGVTVGCAGFAKILAKQLFPDGEVLSVKIGKPVVVISGSVNPITRSQVEYIESKQYPRVSLTANQLLDVAYWETDQGSKEIENYIQLMESHPLLVFETLSNQTSREIKSYGKEQHLSLNNCRFRIGESLGKLTEALWSKHQENTFLFTGGDTLFQSMNVLGVTEIKPISEISPGVVLSTIEWHHKEMQVITKSGGFGDANLFEEIILSK